MCEQSVKTLNVIEIVRVVISGLWTSSNIKSLVEASTTVCVGVLFYVLNPIVASYRLAYFINLAYWA
jgi:hypothetical protein